MKRGNLVEFKPGLFGLQPPDNLGIFLDRTTRKKIVYVTVFTLKGVRELKAAQLQKRKFKYSIDIPKSLSGPKLDTLLRPRLQDLINKHGTKEKQATLVASQGDEEEETILPPNDEHELWRYILKEPATLTLAEMAERWFREDPSVKQMNLIEELVEVSKAPGVGYFEVDSTGRHYTPITEEEYSAAREDIKKLERLRERLVEVEEEEEEDEDGFVHVITHYIPVGLEYATLSEEDWELVRRVQAWMADLVENRTVNKPALGGTHIHTVDKFSLPQFLRFLAEDWTETRELLQPDSAMVEFLLRTNHYSESEALENLAIRAVKEHPKFSWDVDPEIQELASQIPETAEEPESYKGRKDLRELLSYTVDPATARDFDQALSYEKRDDGWVLWVHIADVSHYVTPGSELDDYAKQRATSVYLPSRGLPMHPPALSTGLCALQQDIDRFALTCELQFDLNGNRTKVDIYEAVVHVKANLSYEFVDERLEEGNPYWVGMLELGNLLRSKFNGLNVETKEARLSTKESTLGFTVEQASPSTSMNEIFMIRANEAIAERLRDSGMHGFYRIHPIPDSPDVEKFNDQMVALGIDYEVSIPSRPTSVTGGEEEAEEEEEEGSVLDMLKSGGKMTLMGGGMAKKKTKKEKEEEREKKEEENAEKSKPVMFGLAHLSEEDTEKWMAPFREVLNEVRKVEDKNLRMVMMLTTLGMFGRAYYTPDNLGHFGLGSRCYTHFTAPIRRYSDIIVHRILKGVIRGTATADKPVYTYEELEELSEHVSDQSFAAEKLEVRVVGAGLAMMTRRPDWAGNLSGVVTRVSPRMVSVVIREVLDGRIRTSDLAKGEIAVDPAESIAFVKRDEDYRMKKILNSTDWQEMLDEEGEPVEVLVRLGQTLSVKIVARDYVDGRVTVQPS